MSKISNLAGNAILAKARAMSAGFLTDEDYASLINCRNVNEVVSYLRSNTAYSEAQSLSSTTGFSKARMETEIRKYNYGRIAALASFEKAIGQKMNELIFLNYDISLILSCADRLDSKAISKFSLFSPEAYYKHSQLNRTALEAATDFDSFYAALEGTKYQHILDIFKNPNAEFTITGLENALYRYLCDNAAKLVKKEYKGEAEKGLSKIFMAKSDFKMIESIYRMKKYFPAQPCTYETVFYSNYSAFSKNEIDRMLSCTDTDGVFEIFKKSVYGKFVDESLKDNIEKCTHRAALSMNRKNLLFSTAPEVVMFSYIGILENETKNIIMITEGVDYSLSPESISEFLIK